jgi:AMP-binding enzyme
MSIGWDSIPAMAAATAERFGDRLAVADGDTRLTWAELHDQAQTFGAALVASGVQPGDRVALWAPNNLRWIVAVLGLWQAGAVLVPVNTRFKGVEAADILTRSRARALVTVTDFLGTDYLALLEATGTERTGTRRSGGVGRLPGAGDRRDAGRGGAAQRGRHRGRPVRRPLHLRHDGRAEGRGHDPGAHPPRRQ